MSSMEEADKAARAMRSEAKRANLPAVHNRLESEIHECSNRSAIGFAGVLYRVVRQDATAARRFPCSGAHKHGYVMYRTVEFDRKRTNKLPGMPRGPRC